MTSSAEMRLDRLVERLLTAAEASLAAGDLEPARVTAEEVRAVDPGNQRAARILVQVARRHLGPAGERALMTVLFADLVGSTMLSERVEPEQLRDLFAFYRDAAADAVSRYRGSLVQYLGDGILAAFGYPEPHEDDARRAVLAGLDLGVAMRDAHAEMDRRFGVAPEVRVGIHTGRVVVTDLSADRSVAERDSIVGLVTNLAARIQQAAEPGTVVISDVTRQLVDPDFYLRSLGVRTLKGITRPVEIFAVERPRYAAARFEAERYRKAGLVGRDEPRDRLLSAWRDVRRATAPDGAAFLVVGEAGIGKSRLVAEVLDRVESSGGRVLGVGCLPFYANVSLWPVARLLERELGTDEPDRAAALVTHLAALDLDPARSVPFLASLAGIPAAPQYPAPELEPSAFLDETLDRLVEWISALARRGPHLLVVEDLHWADPSTLGLLGRLVDRCPPGLLTVATTREASVVPWREGADVVELGRLEDAAAARLIDNLVAGGEGLSGDRRSAVLGQAEGIPLFIEELTRTYLDAPEGDALPLRIQELFTSRLKAPGVDLRVVQVAATVGPTFDGGIVAEVVGDIDAVSDQLRLLTDDGIIEPTGPASGTYRFRHALMRDAAYETQVLDVRRATHADVAETLGRHGAEPALVAQHLDLAGAAERAAAAYTLAAQAEQARGAHPEATRLLTRALELLETLPATDQRHLAELTAVMLRVMSTSSMRGYAAPEVQSDHRRAEVLATGLGSRPEVLPSLIANWSYWLVHGDLGTARGLIERLGGMVAGPAFAWFAPEVTACAGFQDFFEGHLVQAQTQLDRAMAGFSARPPDQTVSPFWPLPHDPVAVSAVALACVTALRGGPAEARRWEAAAVRRTEDIGFPRGPFSLGFVNVFAAWVRRFLGDEEGSWRLGAEAVALGKEHGYALWTTLGAAYTTTGTPGGAEHRAALRQTIAVLHVIGQESFGAAHLAYLAVLHERAGELDEAETLVTEALDVVRRTGECVHLPELLRQQAGYAEARGRREEAATLLTEAVRVSVEQGARVSRLRAALALARLPGSARPDDWRTVLAEATADLPPSLRSGERTAAAEILAG